MLIPPSGPAGQIEARMDSDSSLCSTYHLVVVKGAALESDSLGWSFDSIHYWLCDLGHLTNLCTSVSSNIILGL